MVRALPQFQTQRECRFYLRADIATSLLKVHLLIQHGPFQIRSFLSITLLLLVAEAEQLAMQAAVVVAVLSQEASRSLVATR